MRVRVRMSWRDFSAKDRNPSASISSTKKAQELASACTKGTAPAVGPARRTIADGGGLAARVGAHLARVYSIDQSWLGSPPWLLNVEVKESGPVHFSTSFVLPILPVA